MSKKDIIKVVITNIVIAVITTFVMMLVLKVSINIGNFSFFLLLSIITFILGNLIFLIKKWFFLGVDKNGKIEYKKIKNLFDSE